MISFWANLRDIYANRTICHPYQSLEDGTLHFCPVKKHVLGTYSQYWIFPEIEFLLFRCTS